MVRVWDERLQQNDRRESTAHALSVTNYVRIHENTSSVFFFMGIAFYGNHLFFSSFWKVLQGHLANGPDKSHAELPFLFWGGRQGEGPLISKRVVISCNENEFLVPHHPTPSAPLWSQATCYSYRIFIDVYTHAYISDWLTIINYLYVSVPHTVEGKYKKENY